MTKDRLPIFRTDALAGVACAAIDEAPRARSYRYSVWQHHSNAMLLTSESVLMQRVNYIHLNPVRDGLVERADEYQWSSYRFWRQCRRDDEPLVVDLDQIRWRRA